jgi:hypothetical protein
MHRSIMQGVCQLWGTDCTTAATAGVAVPGVTYPGAIHRPGPPPGEPHLMGGCSNQQQLLRCIHCTQQAPSVTG